MAHKKNVKQADGEDCPRVCQTNGEVDIHAGLVKLTGFIVKCFYKALKAPALETVAPQAGDSRGEMATDPIKADAMRPFAYKFVTSPNRA